MPARPTEARRAPSGRAEVTRLAGELYQANENRLRRFAWTQIGRAPHDVVEDVIQSALVAFIQSYSGDPTDEEGALKYLLVAVRTAAWRFNRTSARKRAPLVSLDELTDSSSALSAGSERRLRSGALEPEEAVIERERYDESRRIFAQLPADQRACLALSALALSTREIAAALGLSERQVRRCVNKGNRRLRELEGGTR